MMELEMVLNELSLQPLAHTIPEARQRMLDLVSTMSTATKAGVSRVLRTARDLSSEELAPDYLLVQWRNDREVDQVARSYFRSLTTKAPYLADISNPVVDDKFSSSEFFYNNKHAGGLGVAYLLEALALSIRSEACWDSHHLELNYAYLHDDGAILSENVTVMHASYKDHLREHAIWIKEHLSSDCQNGTDIWRQRERLFPNLQFCDSVGKALQAVSVGNAEFHLMLKKLYLLEEFCQQWQVDRGPFSLQIMPLKGSIESEPTLEKYRQEHTFYCPDGNERIFSLHVRITDYWRIYYYPIEEERKLVIGHVGKHLPTVKYPQ